MPYNFHDEARAVIAMHRRRNPVTVKALAKATGCPQRALGLVLSGDRNTYRHLVAVLTYFNVDIAAGLNVAALNMELEYDVIELASAGLSNPELGGLLKEMGQSKQFSRCDSHLYGLVSDPQHGPVARAYRVKAWASTHKENRDVQ